jgi:hypothetical protein
MVLRNFDIGAGIGATIAEAVHILPQTESAMGIVAGEIRLDHKPGDCRSIAFRHAKRNEGGSDKPLNVGGGEALAISPHSRLRTKGRHCQIREPA